MRYDPFARGTCPVGVWTTSITRGDRLLPIEIWYPAEDAHRGADVHPDSRDQYDLIPGFPPGWQEAVRDAAPRAGRFPLICFSHGFGGHRRQSTFLCTHLASHGYVVAAVDHTGNTMVDIMQAMLAMMSGTPAPPPGDALAEFVEHRPADVGAMLDHVLASEWGARVDADRVGMSGHSFGGWTTLVVTARDTRIKSALPLAPAGGATHLPAKVLVDRVEVDYRRSVPTTFIAADGDSLLPLDGVRTLHERVTGPSRLVVLVDSDHMHFMDRIDETHEMFRMLPQGGLFPGVQERMRPMAELMPGVQAYEAVRGVGLAHFDATLKGDAGAQGFLAGDVGGALGERGIRVLVE